MGGWEDIKATAYDKSLPVYRPKIRTGNDGKPSEVQTSANWDRALALANAFTVSVTLSSWTNDAGVLFDPGQGYKTRTTDYQGILAQFIGEGWPGDWRIATLEPASGSR
jgi:prophage tail gpP-like protein